MSTRTVAGVALGPGFGPMTSLPGVLTGRPPWPANARPAPPAHARDRPRAVAGGGAGRAHPPAPRPVRLRSPRRGLARHRIDPSGGFLAALHTHDASGVLHVKSATESSYTLGQAFAVWGVRLDARCLGGLCARDRTRLRAWVNGRAVAADPTRIVLADHQEIVLAFGTPAQDPRPVPARYDFAAIGL